MGHHGRLRTTASAARPKLEIADVFRAFGAAYRIGHALSVDQAKVFAAILACRTATLGGHLDVCEDCGFERPSYNSCFNRHCPKCQAIAAARWVDARQKAILPVRHFHVVFTLPAQLRPLALRNRQAVFDLLFEAASQTLLKLGHDPARLGALLGLTAVLHTWSRDLSFHPHLHCIVTAGGLGNAGWLGVRGGRFLFPVDVMGRLFRGKLLSGLRRLYRNGRLVLTGACADLEDPAVFEMLLDKLYRTPFRPYAERPFAGPARVFEYLGYYTHRVGISGHRLLAIDHGLVRFKTRSDKTATLSGEEFIRRFLLHVLPRGFVKIRHYGLLAASAASKREHARASLNASAELRSPETQVPKAVLAPSPETLIFDLLRLCPSCGHHSMVRRPLPERPPPRQTETTP